MLASPSTPRTARFTLPSVAYDVLARASSSSHSATHVRHACGGGGGGSVAPPDNRMRFRGEGGACDPMLSGSTVLPFRFSLPPSNHFPLLAYTYPKLLVFFRYAPICSPALLRGTA
ncbi:uncharacterized protein PAN0_003c1549 [Moesziomyces antarcticus]|uniref:uncharacterized protein n=1 Tax=Pseudozyma antarctica TaxID=84753 RepID=UPI0007194BFE|nr:uncharacterized protein PAN0_003c1549 [Moesziomyces antarcticus]GAK63345.1 hypothetical protein PAN0_003c1549 [Moesziomyces antarcticus]